MVDKLAIRKVKLTAPSYGVGLTLLIEVRGNCLRGMYQLSRFEVESLLDGVILVRKLSADFEVTTFVYNVTVMDAIETFFHSLYGKAHSSGFALFRNPLNFCVNCCLLLL